MPVDGRTLEYVHSLLQAMRQNTDWKTAFDAVLVSLRDDFVYDNVAVYLLDGSTQTLEVNYARAVGRGKRGVERRSTCIRPGNLTN